MVDELITALVVTILLISIFSRVIVLGLIGANVELDGALSTIKKLVDFDEVGVKVLLLYVLAPKFGKVLFDVIANVSAAGLPKLNVGATVLGIEGTTFSEDFAVLVIVDAIDTFVCFVVSIVLAIKFVFSFARIFVSTFGCAGDVFGEQLKVASDFVSTFALGLDKEKPLGMMAAVDSGVVLTFVVVVEELRVAQLTGSVTGGVTVLTSSA